MFEKLHAYLVAALAWCVAHPEKAWPILSGLVVLALKRRTPGHYAKLAAKKPVWLFARLAGLLQAIGGLGLDPYQAAAGLWKAVTGTQAPPPPPKGPSILPLLIVACLALNTTACSVDRSVARGAVLASAAAVKAADETCAAVALERNDQPLALECAVRYTEARLAIVGAAKTVDAWEEAKSKKSVSCAVTKAAEALKAVRELLAKRAAKLPPLIDDALDLAAKLGGCPEAAS